VGVLERAHARIVLSTFVSRGRCGGDLAHARRVMLECAPVGNPYLPYDRQDGARPGLDHEHPDLADCRELRTPLVTPSRCGQSSSG
jgi:hypothetical protein